MKRFVYLFVFFVLFISSSYNKSKMPVYAWIGYHKEKGAEETKQQFEDYKSKGIDGLMFSGGHNPEVYRHVGKIAKSVGLEFYAWIPTMVQGTNKNLDTTLYAINGLGESAYSKPAYVSYYKFLCPSKKKVHDFLTSLYVTIANVDEVDGIHLDYIRFPDVILAKGLWEKYNLIMDKEYPQFDYCYCDDCVVDFMELSGINIKTVNDPSTIDQWKQFRYDLITKLVNKLADTVHSRKKKINAAVFPGPHSIAKKIVRQEWDKWNIDAYYPMNYNDFYLQGTKWIGEVTKEGVKSIHNTKPIYSGLFICPNPEKKLTEKDPENHGLLPEELEEAIKQSINNGAAGICLFTPERMTDAHWKVFKKAIYIKKQG